METVDCSVLTGHSVGELGCAYADGCLTAEEMILSAYSRGLVSIQTPFIRGSMAAVGIGFEEVRIPYLLIITSTSLFGFICLISTLLRLPI